MKNKDIYKTPEERMNAFDDFCSSVDSCDDCMLQNFMNNE
jgi:hypothetical protein